MSIFAACFNRICDMIRLEKYRVWLLLAVLTICGTASFASCASNEGNGKVAEILNRGTILVGTTDYRPLSFREADGTYWGFGIDVANEIAKRIGVGVEFIKTSWPTLTADVLAEPQLFDLAIGGITITDTRRETMLMSDGYLANGKTILCRASEADRYKSLADIDKPDVTVMVNPGGLNEKFANENLTHANIVVHSKNEEMQKGQEDLLQIVNNVIHQMKSDGSLRKLHEKYGLVYAYSRSTF